MRVAVIGGAGYVGGFVCHRLIATGHDVTVVAGGNASFLMEGAGVRVSDGPRAITEGPYDVVVNLAYPNRGSNLAFPQRNRELADLVRALARRAARVVHTSTLAVFGFELDRPQTLGPAPSRRDFPYVELKAEMERLLCRDCGAPALDVIRLGNVWGPASPTWTAPLADKLLFGEPVGVIGRDGISNVTDVVNVADYIAFVAEGSATEGVRFHHLAEHATVPWSDWIAPLAGFLGVSPILAASLPPVDTGWPSELRHSLGSVSPIAIARDWRGRRRLGSVYRSVIRLLPQSSHDRLRRIGLPGGYVDPERMEDESFLRVLATAIAFEHHTLPGWQAPRSRAESAAATLQWMQEAGY